MFEIRPRLVRQLEERPQRGMIDHEIHLRPILGCLSDVPNGCIFPDAGERFLVVGRQQSLVDAERVDAGLHRFVVERIHHLLVVEPPRELGGRQWIADRIGLPGIRLVDLDRLVNLLHPAGLFGRDDTVRQQAPGASEIVDELARLDDLFVG